jgi:hypothetical protein
MCKNITQCAADGLFITRAFDWTSALKLRQEGSFGLLAEIFCPWRRIL